MTTTTNVMTNYCADMTILSAALTMCTVHADLLSMCASVRSGHPVHYSCLAVPRAVYSLQHPSSTMVRGALSIVIASLASVHGQARISTSSSIVLVVAVVVVLRTTLG